MFRLPLIGTNACTQHFGHPFPTSHLVTVAAQPARRPRLMPLRDTSTPYSLSTQRFQRARVLLRLKHSGQGAMTHAQWSVLHNPDYLSVFQAIGDAWGKRATP